MSRGEKDPQRWAGWAARSGHHGYFQNMQGPRDTFKGYSICVIGIPKEERGVEEERTGIYIAKNFPKLVTDSKPQKLTE